MHDSALCLPRKKKRKELLAEKNIKKIEGRRDILIKEQMDTQKDPKPAVSSSCRKKMNDDNATFLANLKDHIDEFVHSSMDEHKTCFKNTFNKIFGMSKAIAENKAEAKEVETHSTLQATVAK